jgi:hypothetical protein
MACERELASFIPVVAVQRRALPESTARIVSSSEVTILRVSPWIRTFFDASSRGMSLTRLLDA